MQCGQAYLALRLPTFLALLPRRQPDARPSAQPSWFPSASRCALPPLPTKLAPFAWAASANHALARAFAANETSDATQFQSAPSGRSRRSPVTVIRGQCFDIYKDEHRPRRNHSVLPLVVVLDPRNRLGPPHFKLDRGRGREGRGPLVQLGRRRIMIRQVNNGFCSHKRVQCLLHEKHVYDITQHSQS